MNNKPPPRGWERTKQFVGRNFAAIFSVIVLGGCVISNKFHERRREQEALISPTQTAQAFVDINCHPWHQADNFSGQEACFYGRIRHVEYFPKGTRSEYYPVWIAYFSPDIEYGLHLLGTNRDLMPIMDLCVVVRGRVHDLEIAAEFGFSDDPQPLISSCHPEDHECSRGGFIEWEQKGACSE